MLQHGNMLERILGEGQKRAVSLNPWTRAGLVLAQQHRGRQQRRGEGQSGSCRRWLPANADFRRAAPPRPGSTNPCGSKV